VFGNFVPAFTSFFGLRSLTVSFDEPLFVDLFVFVAAFVFGL